MHAQLRRTKILGMMQGVQDLARNYRAFYALVYTVLPIAINCETFIIWRSPALWEDGLLSGVLRDLLNDVTGDKSRSRDQALILCCWLPLRKLFSLRRMIVIRKRENDRFCFYRHLPPGRQRFWCRLLFCLSVPRPVSVWCVILNAENTS
jgi:hypothetical protein